MSDTQVIVEYEHERDEQVAGNCMRALCEAYPGHPWHVNITGGVIVIKHMAIITELFGGSPYGMVLHYKKVVDDAKRLKRGVVMAGGELLERSHQLRAKVRDEERITQFDDNPKKTARK